MRRLILVLIALLASTITASHMNDYRVSAQGGERAARLRVTQRGVEVQRVNTSAFVRVQRETLVGVGDRVRSGDGRGVLSFASNLLTVDLLAGAEVLIQRYEGEPAQTTLDVTVTAGFVRVRARQPLTEAQRVTVQTPAFTVRLIRGITAFRIETIRRSSVIVAVDSQATVTSDTAAATVDVPAFYGVRAEPQQALSDVVVADSFEKLDAALDGCPSRIVLKDDVRLNVRLGASLDFPRIGGIDTNTPIQAMGVAASGGWYRIRYKGGFGWIRVPGLPFSTGCAGLRIFANGYGPEDVTLFADLTENISLTPTVAP